MTLDTTRERWIANRIAKSMESGLHSLPESIIKILVDEEPTGWAKDGTGIRPYYGGGTCPEDWEEVEPTYEGKLDYYERTVNGSKEEEDAQG